MKGTIRQHESSTRRYPDLYKQNEIRYRNDSKSQKRKKNNHQFCYCQCCQLYNEVMSRQSKYLRTLLPLIFYTDFLHLKHLNHLINVSVGTMSIDFLVSVLIIHVVQSVYFQYLFLQHIKNKKHQEIDDVIFSSNFLNQK